MTDQEKMLPFLIMLYLLGQNRRLTLNRLLCTRSYGNAMSSCTAFYNIVPQSTGLGVHAFFFIRNLPQGLDLKVPYL